MISLSYLYLTRSITLTFRAENPNWRRRRDYSSWPERVLEVKFQNFAERKEIMRRI